MDKETVKILVEAARALDKHASKFGDDHGWNCAAIDAENTMHFAAMEFLGTEEDSGDYDPDHYLLKATTPEACDWVLQRIEDKS